MKRLWVILQILVPLCASADDGCGQIDSCSYSSMWSGFSELRVTYSDSKEKKGSEFVYMVADPELVMTFPTKQGTATIFSVPGVATLWRGIGAVGIKSAPSCYEDVRDTFAIIQSYAVRALFFVGFGVKGGPELVSDAVKIDISNPDDTRVQINPGDHTIIKGPWSLKGTVKRTDHIEFQLSLESTVEAAKRTLFLNGTWRKDAIALPVDDAQSLNDWLVCLSGTYSREDGKEQFMPAVQDTTSIKTVGDIRALTNRSSRRP